MFEYDLETNVWKDIKDETTPPARYAAGMGSVGHRLYVVGGYVNWGERERAVWAVCIGGCLLLSEQDRHQSTRSRQADVGYVGQ